MKRLLITGGSGYLGQHLTAVAKTVGDFDLYSSYHSHSDEIKDGQPIPLNLTNRAELLRLITDLSPQAIIHTAAINPGGNSQQMMNVNADGSRYIAEGAAAVGARLVHVSTDVIHNGRNAPYEDDVLPTPLNLYGRSKAAAEAAVTELYPQATIVRTSLIYGLNKIDRGTAGLAQRLNSGEMLTLFNDVIRQPIWVETLAEALLKLLDVDFGGIINIAGGQALTREEFARRMFSWWGIDFQGKVKSGRAVDISDAIPLDLRLSIAKVEKLLQCSFPGVDELLAMTKNL